MLPFPSDCLLVGGCLDAVVSQQASWLSKFTVLWAALKNPVSIMISRTQAAAVDQ